MRFFVKAFVWLFFLAVLIVGSFLLFARYHPINLTPVAEKVVSVVAPDTQFTFDELWFTHDGKFTLEAKNVVFEGGEKNHIGAVETLQMRLANRSLMLFKPSPKHIVVKGIFYEGSLQTKETQEAQQTHEVLKKVEKFLSRMAWLKTIEIEDVNIVVHDPNTKIRWALQEGKGKGTYYFEEGLNIRIHGQLAQNEEKFAPALLNIATNPRTETSRISLALERLNMGWFKPYLPIDMKDMLQGQLNVSVGTAWQADTGWQPLFLESQLSDITLTLPEAFSIPQTYDAMSVKGAYHIENDALSLERVKLSRGTQEVSLTALISTLRTEPHVSASGSLIAEHTADIWPWFPSVKMKRSMPFLTQNISATFSAPASVKLHAPIRKLFNCLPDEPCEQIQLKASFDEGATIKPLKNAPKITTTSSATMVWEKGHMRFDIPKAQMGVQTLTDVETIVADVQTPPNIPTRILVNSQIEGQLDPLLKVVKPLFNIDSSYHLKGLHDSHLALELPLIKGVPITVKDASLTVSLKTSSAQVTPQFKGQNLYLKKAELTLQGDQLKSKGGLRYGEIVSKYKLDYQLKNNALKSQFDGNFELSDLPLEISSTLAMSGTAPLQMILKQTSKNAPFVFDVQADLTPATLTFYPVNWHHKQGEKLTLKAQGTWMAKEKSLNTELFSLVGDGVEVGGQIYAPIGEPLHKMNVQLSPIVLGNNNVNISYRDHALTVSGSELDLSRIFEGGRKNKTVWPEAFTAKIDLNRVRFKNGYLLGVDVVADRTENLWKNVKLDGQLPNFVPFNFRYNAHGDGYQMNARTEDLGMLLSTVGVTEKVRGGQMLSRLTLDGNHNGTGIVTLNNAHFVEAPLLVQLVSLLSLEELTSGGEGIDFKSGAFPIVKKGNSYRLKKAYLDGPSMALNLSGEIVPRDQYINLEGQFIPTAGINRVVDSIPLLGDILTGSQEGILVAEFKTKGNWKNPETSVNPLKSVTPGIIKDFFRILTGKDDE